MAAYIVRRLAWVIVLLFVVTLLTFIIFTVLPAADPATLRAGRQPSPELIESIRNQFGLDDPKHEQFLRYIGDICRRSSTGCRPRSSSPQAPWCSGSALRSRSA